MDLRPYIEDIHRQLALAAEAGGDESRALAERLAAPLEASIRLALQDALASAAEEITLELAPGSVEVRLRGRNPEFVVTPPPAGPTAGDEGVVVGGTAEAAPAYIPGTGEEGEMSRINLRIPDQLKTRIEEAAARDGLSTNAWLMRMASAALERSDPTRRPERTVQRGTQRYTGWGR